MCICYWGAALTLKLPFMPINLREKFAFIYSELPKALMVKTCFSRGPISFVVNHFGSARINPLVAGELETIQIGSHGDEMKSHVVASFCSQKRIGSERRLLFAGAINFRSPESIVAHVKHIIFFNAAYRHAGDAPAVTGGHRA